MTKLPPPIVHQPRGELPILLSVPHSGREYPDWLVALSSGGKRSLATLEDPFVDRLIWRALQRGCGAVIARTPRAAIDCNRSEDEVDPSVIDGARRGRVSARARGGLGIIPGRTQQHGFLWRRAISPAQLDDRVAQAHRPYHDAIEAQLALLIDRFGCALLLDCHSMPPPAEGIPPIVLGDCRGKTADPWLSAAALTLSRQAGFEAVLNTPFAGGHVIARHAEPSLGVQALQVEIDRRAYLDERLAKPGPGFDQVAALLETLAVELGQALLDRRFAMAAE